jgi:hypothetical protein
MFLKKEKIQYMDISILSVLLDINLEQNLLQNYFHLFDIECFHNGQLIIQNQQSKKRETFLRNTQYKVRIRNEKKSYG